MARGNFRHDLNIQIRAAVRAVLTSMGRDFRDNLRDILSVPVTYIGSEAIRSEPGESPYRESRDLWKSIKYKVAAKAQTVEALRIYSDMDTAEYSGYLEDGTENIEPRPHWSVAYEQAGDLGREFKRRLAAELRSRGLSPRAYSGTSWRR